MKKKSLFIAIATLFFISISSAMMTPCTDIFDECIESNPFSVDEGLHEFQAHVGYVQGCLNFLDACFQQE